MNPALAANVTLTTLEARVFDLDAAVARARRQIERSVAVAREEFRRDVAVLGLAFYNSRSRHHLRRVELELGIIMSQLTDAQLRQISKLLREPIEPLRPYVALLETTLVVCRRYERPAFRGFCSMIGDIDRLAETLSRRAGFAPRATTPSLSPRMRADALFASAMLPAARRDPSEDDIDPDYGF